MFRRRFVVLAGVLAALTVALVSASPGLAIRHAVVTQLFGPKMVRAVAVERNGDQWNLDRGVITQVSGTQLTLLEADGRVQPIPLADTTRVIRLRHQLPLTALAKHWRVLVTWPATGPAVSVDVEKIPHRQGKAVFAVRRAIIAQLFGLKMVRAVAVEKNGDQWNLDRGAITQVNSSQLTLNEADGRVQPIALSGATKVLHAGSSLSPSDLAPRWRVLVTWPATGPRSRWTSRRSRAARASVDRRCRAYPEPVTGGATGGSLLLVEDDDSIGRLVKQYLEQQDGWRVVWLRTGEEAIAELRGQPVRLVVLDIGLPGHRRLRGLPPDPRAARRCRS